MSVLYLDCSMGAAGDMLSAALYELLDAKGRASYMEKIGSLGLEGVSVSAQSAQKCGITGTHMSVKVDGLEEDEHVHDHEHEHDHDHEHHHEHEHDHEHEHHHDHDHEHTHHHHSSMADVSAIIEALGVSDLVKENAKAVYGLIAEAESVAHGMPVSDIHFHEVGTKDAIVDVVSVCLLMEMLAPDKVIASPVHVGSGHVHCAHGILPVPAPATAYILKGVPIYGGSIEGELCTPTGAALLKHFADSFENMPPMKVSAIGYGMGKKDFKQANCLRAMLGEMPLRGECITELSCNVDDMTAEEMGFAVERLLAMGAVEAYTIPLGMKKSRPGMMLCVMCSENKRDELVKAIFKYTTTLGVRENISKRYTLTRRIETEETPMGKIRVKKSEGYGVCRSKYEYEDLAKIAREKELSLGEVLENIKKE